MDRILPQLATPIDDPNDIKHFLQSPDWVAEQKINGGRCLVEIYGGINAYNRLGADIALPNKVLADFAGTNWSGEWVFDGELVDTKLWVFDLLGGKNGSLLLKPYKARRKELEKLIGLWKPANIGVVPVARSEAEKVALTRSLRDAHAEGVMFKKIDSLYQPDTRADTWRKLKFVKTADVVVTELAPEGKASIRIHVFDAKGEQVDVGGCAVRADMLRMLREGDVVTLRYLYATDDNKLFQPAFMMGRDDKTPEQCTIDQLQYTTEEVFTMAP